MVLVLLGLLAFLGYPWAAQVLCVLLVVCGVCLLWGVAHLLLTVLLYGPPLALLAGCIGLTWLAERLDRLVARLRPPRGLVRLAQRLPTWLVGPWPWTTRLETWFYDHLDAVKYSVIGLGLLALLLAGVPH